MGESIWKLFCVETTAQKDFAEQSIFRKVNLNLVPITQKLGIREKGKYDTFTIEQALVNFNALLMTFLN